MKRKKVSTFFKKLQKSFGQNCGDIEHNSLYVVERLKKSKITDKFEKLYKYFEQSEDYVLLVGIKMKKVPK